MTLDPKSLWYLGSVPLIIALVQLAKLWIKDTRFYPFIAVLVGILLNLFIGDMIVAPISLSVLAGIIAGLTAAGLYSGTTTLTQKKQTPTK
ncbi:MAG: hypothetical protein ACYDHZ_00755 [Dehalococcoidia bacterium]